MKTPPPNPSTLTAFSQQAKQQIEGNRFAATTGALVTLSASAFWELYYAAIAWHEHATTAKARRKHPPCGQCLGTGKNLMHGHQCPACDGTGAMKDQQSATTT